MPETEFIVPAAVARSSRALKLVYTVLFSAFPLMGLGLAWMCLLASYDTLVSPTPDYGSLLELLLLVGGCSAFCLRLGWCILSRYLARFRFLKEGLAVTFPLRQEEIFPWEDFQQLCVCYTGYPHQDPNGKILSVICCVKKGEKKNICGRWKESDFHYRTVIHIEFRPETLEALRQFCPFPVPDLRGIGNYRP